VGIGMTIPELLWRRIPERVKPHLRFAIPAYRSVYMPVRRRIVLISPIRPFKVAKFKRYSPLKLNVGCGQVKYAGWVNIDIEPGSDITIDIRDGLPFNDNSVDFIYNEHVLEHLTFEEGTKVLKEFARCLKLGGVLRIAMPNLDYVIERYNSDWRNQEWLSFPEYKFIASRGRMINICFSSWGHKYIYNEEDLGNQLTAAGFQQVTRCEWNKSAHAELAGLETKRDSKLVIEATKQ